MALKKSDSDEELANLFNWDPMRDTFEDSKFNSYVTGPGANVDVALQVSSKTKPAGNERPYLFISGVPKKLTMKGVHNLCSQFGRVVQVRHGKVADHKFVDFATLGDMEAAYRGLKSNKYGITAQVGWSKNKQQKSPSSGCTKQQSTEAGDESIHTVDASNDNVILINRFYAPSDTCPSRPYIEKRKFVTVQDYDNPDNDLQHNDPQRHFLIEDDAHAMERAGVKIYHDDELNDQGYKYALGRAYKEMPASLRMQLKSKQCAGQYDASRKRFVVNVGEAKKPKFGSCIQCQLITNKICSKCSAYFCSAECIRKAWPKHRLECHDKNSGNLVSVQKVDKPQRTISKHLNLAELPANNSVVAMVSVCKTNLVFIRSKSNEEYMRYFKIISEINISERELRKLQFPPKLGQIVLTKFHSEICRAMILNAEDMGRISFVYIDFGNIGTENFTNLFEATEDIINLSRCTVPVTLKDVPDCFMTNEMRKLLYYYLEKVDLKLKYAAAKGIACVELIDCSSNTSVNKSIACLCTVNKPTVGQEVNRDFLKRVPLPQGADIELVVMDNSLLSTGVISCATKEGALEVMKFSSEVQRYGASLESNGFAPQVHGLCIAKYKVDQRWYRARCVELVGDGCPTITYIDYGNVDIVSLNDIYLYPRQFKFPVFTVDCEIKDVREIVINGKLRDKLANLIPIGGIIRCANVKARPERKYYEINLPEVTKFLKDEGYLDSDKNDGNENHNDENIPSAGNGDREPDAAASEA